MCLTAAQAFKCGDALIEAKAIVPSGTWHRWLKNNCKLGKRTALRYIRLAQNRAEIKDKLDTEKLSPSLRALERLIAQRKVTAPGMHSSAGVPASAPTNPPTGQPDERWLQKREEEQAAVKLAETASKLLWQAFGQLDLGHPLKTFDVLQRLRAKLRTQAFDFHDMRIVIERNASSRPRARRRGG